MLWPMRGFVIDGDKAHLCYSGIRGGLHGDMYSDQGNCGAFEGAFCRATWELGRMWAAIHYLGNDREAYLTTPALACGGKTLFVNAVTRDAGKVEAELLDAELKPVEGYARADCRALRGDEKCAPLTWGASSKVALETAHLRIILTDARLYGFEWR